jgi:CMP-N-acetylneuraminic acid synthetase
MSTILGVITARGGSKGIPRKNIRPLCGKPLIAYTIEAAQKSKLLTHVIVSTDDEEIAAIAKSFGADVPFLRPKELATDKSSSLDVVNHALTWMRDNKGRTFDYAMILQPTSPLRTDEDIDACISLAVEKDADSVMSMVEVPDSSPEKLKRIEGGIILPLLQEEGASSAQRTAGEPVYKRNTAVYLTKTSLLEKDDLFGKHSVAYVMPRERSVDINDEADFDLATFYLTHHD